MLRPQACRWFELVAARDALAAVMTALARSGAVELQAHDTRRAVALVVAGAAPALARWQTLERQHAAHWPPPRAAATAPPLADPSGVLAARLAQLDAWRADAEPLLADAERLDAQRRELDDLAALLRADPALLPAPALLRGAGRGGVALRIHALAAPLDSHAHELPADALVLPVAAGERRFLIALGRADTIAALDERLAARHARRVPWPADLGGASVADAARDVAARRAALDAQRGAIDAELRVIAERHDVAGARADFTTVDWLIRHGADVSASERLVWITGWTTAAAEAELDAALARDGLRGVVRFAPPPPDAEPPALLANPRWARAFEAFARLLGQPARDEADPSTALALIAPLLFGFMFGDVGQGVVLMAAGWVLRRRAPMLVLLVPGGALAVVFGLLFGSVFAREDVIPALWLHPLHEPATLLVAAIALGAAILAAGLAFAALQAHWRGSSARWWASDAGLALAWIALLAAPLQPDALWLALAGAAWYVGGAAATAGASRGAALAAAAARFVEQLLQLVVNTLSFARVGAFALAHAGLSVAVVGVAEASGGVGYWIVLVLGNALILVLEGLVVGIQTTRLLLFEFFVRFLAGRGRAFRPLAPPRPSTPATALPAPGSP